MLSDFFVRNLLILVISHSVCPLQAFRAYSYKRSSLVQKLVHYHRKKFYEIGLRLQYSVKDRFVFNLKNNR